MKTPMIPQTHERSGKPTFVVSIRMYPLHAKMQKALAEVCSEVPYDQNVAASRKVTRIFCVTVSSYCQIPKQETINQRYARECSCSMHGGMSASEAVAPLHHARSFELQRYIHTKTVLCATEFIVEKELREHQQAF